MMVKSLLFVLLILTTAAAKKPAATSFASKKWLTLSGEEPVVVARGGFSGLFPESVQYANDIAISSSVNDVVILCNLQLTKNGVGICQPDVRLDNTTTIAKIYPNQSRTYDVNGLNVSGWFAFDFTYKQLTPNVTAVQSILSRPDLFDGYFPISTIDDVLGSKPPGIWLNIQHDQLYKEHNLSMESYLLSNGLQTADFISSPEIGFLKSIRAQIAKDKGSRTLLFLVFQDKNATEPTTNQTYDAIISNLLAIKTFVNGIVVPKEYIWPVNAAGYIESSTTLVTDAHKQGLQVFVNGFANDYNRVYNYSYDPSAEYLQFVDNSQFSVDGIITDFPPTASQVVSCFGKFNSTARRKGQPMIISHNGASGVYPGGTNLAYEQAVDDGVDVLGCSVQMSQDGVPFCLDSADLTGNTDAITTFISQSVRIPEVQEAPGVFSFNLQWSQIQALKPQMKSPYEELGLYRNPVEKNSGKLVTLSEHLELAKSKAVSGILINIENAAYLASKKGLDIVGVVGAALTNSSLDTQSTPMILIQSDDTSVLAKFQNHPKYKRVLSINQKVGDAPRKPIKEIKRYADAVTLTRGSVIFARDGFAVNTSKVIQEMHAENISVYIQTLMNEVPSLLYDYFTDPTIEVATYTSLGVDGIITEFPKTASRYFSNPCSNLNNNMEFSILPAEPGSLFAAVPEDVVASAPADAPLAVLSIDDVVDPPLPHVIKNSQADSNVSPPASKPDVHAGVVRTVADAATVVAAFVVLGVFAAGTV